jgi:hypothetical protein
MKFRKLRTASSTLCGLAALLLIVFWLRSYSQLDYCKVPIGALHIHTIKGKIIFFALPQRPDWKFGSVPMQYVAHHPVLSSPYSGWPTPGGFTINEEPPAAHIHLPFLAATLAMAFFGTIVWIPVRFSLRTLLFATTLVAVSLGSVTWSIHR